MSETIERILHTRYKFKVGDTYYVLYLESSGDDVVIRRDIEGLSEESGTTLSVVLSNLKNVLDTLGKKPIATSALELQTQNPKLENGQLGIELDTLKMKVGDGLKTYAQLPYFLTKEIPAENVIVAQGIRGITDNEPANLQQSLATMMGQLLASMPKYMTAEALAAANPKLGLGQLGIEIDTGYVKIGDGNTLYNDLKYFTFRSYGTSPSFHSPIVARSVFLSSLNPMLLDNQIAIEIDTGKVKIGDGSTNFNDLPYMDPSSKSIRMPVTRTSAEFMLDDDVYTSERVLYESDTGKYKIADGVSNYSDLPYVEDGSESGVPDIEETIVDTPEDLAEADPILAYGQICIASDGSRVVIGDGVTPYSQLEPIQSEGLVISGTEFEFSEGEDFTPEKGQIVLETDTGRYKIGDGQSKLSELEYFNGDEVEPTIDGRSYRVTPSTITIIDPETGDELSYSGMKATEANGTVHETIYVTIKGNSGVEEVALPEPEPEP